MNYERNEHRGGQQRYDRTTRDDARDWRNERPEDYEYEDRGFLNRTADVVMSWFGNDEAEARRRFDEMMDRRFGRHSYRASPGDYGRGSRFSRYAESSATGQSTDMGYGMLQSGGSTRIRRVPYADDYANWRERQMADYDRDYKEFSRERQDKFDREFTEWREKRHEQRTVFGTIKEDQEVIGSDGKKVGIVDYIRGDLIILSKDSKAADGHHHSIPSRWIDKIDSKKRVVLNRTASEAHDEWRDIEARKAFFESDYESDDPNITSRTYARTFFENA